MRISSSTVPPKFPCEKIGTDLFEFRGEHFLVSMCYRSKFPEVTKMESTRSSAVIDELKRQFCVHGIPAEVISDNGPQYSSRELQEFAKEYGFKHTTSSPEQTEKQKEPSKLLRICGERVMISTWPYFTIEQRCYLISNCLLPNYLWDVDCEMTCL